MEQELKISRHKADQPMSPLERIGLTVLAALIGGGTIALICVLDKLFGKH